MKVFNLRDMREYKGRALWRVRKAIVGGNIQRKVKYPLVLYFASN